MDLRVGDIVTYQNNLREIKQAIMKDDEMVILFKTDKQYIKVLKIERPDCQVIEVIVEKKDLLTEEERELLEELIDNINQFSCAKVNKISIDKTVHYNIVNFYKNSFYISDIKVNNEFSELDCNKDYTLKELRIGEKVMELEKSIKRLKEKVKCLEKHIEIYEKHDCKTTVYKELIEEKQDLETVLKELENSISKFIEKEEDN